MNFSGQMKSIPSDVKEKRATMPMKESQEAIRDT
jgi:hypothetical protein